MIRADLGHAGRERFAVAVVPVPMWMTVVPAPIERNVSRAGDSLLATPLIEGEHPVPAQADRSLAEQRPNARSGNEGRGYEGVRQT